MTNADDVAALILSRFDRLTTMKLHKLVYYSQCWNLARTGIPLFNESIQAWQQGPIVPELYRRHKGAYALANWPAGDASALTGEQKTVVDWVIAQYGNFSPEELSAMTHAELPWQSARGDLPESASSQAIIQHNVMADYYGRQCADPDTAVGFAAANASLEGHMFDEEWLVRLRDIADGTTDADELIQRMISEITPQ